MYLLSFLDLRVFGSFTRICFVKKNNLTAYFSIIVFIKYFSLQYKNVIYYNMIL